MRKTERVEEGFVRHNGLVVSTVASVGIRVLLIAGRKLHRLPVISGSRNRKKNYICGET